MQTESQEKEVPKDSTNNHFECKICLEVPVEPVATYCGHLYCWSCLYEWAKAKQSQKVPCPSCNSEVAIDKVIPLYTSMENHNKRDKSIPRRPQPEATPFRQNNAQANNGGFAFHLNTFGFNFVFGNVNGAGGQPIQGIRSFIAFLPMLIIMFLPYFIELIANIIEIIVPSLTYFRRSGGQTTRIQLTNGQYVETIESEVEFEDLVLLVITVIGVLVAIAYLLIRLFRSTRR